MIDYTAAGVYAHEVRAFAIIESNENEHSTGADGGRAFGLLQMHPATFIRYYRPVASVGDTWTQAQIKACGSYLTGYNFRLATQEQRDLVVQGWRLGEGAVFSQGKRDPEYLARWLQAYDRIKGVVS